MGMFDELQTSLVGALNTYGTKPANAAANWWNEIQSFTQQADAEAERRFPNQARDSSQKNAFRHALGAGRLAQLLGSNSGIPIVEGAARGAAKLAGYGWEGLGGRENWRSQDMRHDLNANAQGIRQSSQAAGFNELANTLASFAARKEAPPGVTDQARPYFTYTK